MSNYSNLVQEWQRDESAYQHNYDEEEEYYEDESGGYYDSNGEWVYYEEYTAEHPPQPSFNLLDFTKKAAPSSEPIATTNREPDKDEDWTSVEHPDLEPASPPADVGKSEPSTYKIIDLGKPKPLSRASTADMLWDTYEIQRELPEGKPAIGWQGETLAHEPIASETNGSAAPPFVVHCISLDSWHIVFSFLRPPDLCALATVCVAMERMLLRGSTAWRQQAARLHIHKKVTNQLSDSQVQQCIREGQSLLLA